MSYILFDTIWKVCSFTCTLNEYRTGVASSALMSCMLGKSTASELLALCLITCVLGDTAPWLTDVLDFLILITGKVIAIQLYPWLFKNLDQLVTLSGTVSKTEGISWLSHNCINVAHISLLQRQKIM